MLQQICDFVHNYFEGDTQSGTFTISNGVIECPFLKSGQRFRIAGSALNDGIYTYYSGAIFNDDGITGVVLQDETFDGTITGMNVPRAFLDIARDIQAWQEKNQAVLDSPYQSESFGGYTYTKASGSGANAGGALTWRDVFKSRLNAYRKLA